MKISSQYEDPQKKSSKEYLTYFREQFAQGGEALLPAIHQIPLAACVTDQHGYFEEMNEVYCKIYQYSRKELLGKHFSMVVPEADRAYLSELHDQFIEQKYEMIDEWNVERRDGSQVSIFASAAYMEINGRPKKVTFVVDITDIKKAETELKATVSKLNEVLTNQENALEILLHDLRGPITNVLTLAELLSDEELPADRKQSIVQRLLISAKRALKMTERLRAIAQAESGRYQVKPETLEMHQFIEEIWQENAALVKAKQLGIVLSMTGDKPLILSYDAFLLGTAISNLMKNAVEASPEGKSISIKINQQPSPNISIHNWGVIPEEIQGSFFSKYISSGKEHGTGLGTYLAKKTIELLQVSISFHSSEQEGTTLYIQLPAA